MADALFPLADYTAALQALKPLGLAWPREAGNVQDQVLSGLAPAYVRVDARAQTLLVDAFPANTVELLPEWEASLGLPDPCDGETQTVDQRRAQVVNRLVNAGGQSVGYFLGVLARLGYPDASITQYAPFRVGVDHTGWPLYSVEWAFHWTINLPELSVYYLTPGISTLPSPLFSISDGAVVCVIAELMPAHTTVDFTNFS